MGNLLGKLPYNRPRTETADLDDILVTRRTALSR